MSYAPFDPRPVVARLKEAAPGLAVVRALADAESVRLQAGFATPGAYVLLPAESSAQAINGARVTAVDAQFSVILACASFRERRGDVLPEALFALLDAVRAALIGWTPPGIGRTAIRWRGGRVHDVDAATILWLEDYQLNHVLQP